MARRAARSDPCIRRREHPAATHATSRRKTASSLSDSGARSEPGARARAAFHDFEAQSGPMQREIRGKCTALPTGAAAAPVRQAARRRVKTVCVRSPVGKTTRCARNAKCGAHNGSVRVQSEARGPVPLRMRREVHRDPVPREHHGLGIAQNDAGRQPHAHDAIVSRMENATKLHLLG